MNIFQFTAALNLLAAAATGEQRRFSILAYTGGKLNIEGVPLPVVVDLQGLRAESHIPILVDHKEAEDNTLGQTDAIQNDGATLSLAGPITGESEKVLRVVRMADKGHNWQASIGAFVEESEKIPAGRTITVNGQQLSGPFILARKALLRETSVLPMGADPKTLVNLAAAAAGLLKGVAMSFEEWVKSLGLDAATISDALKTALQSQYEAMQAANTQAAGAADTKPAEGADKDKKPDPAAVAAAAAVNLRAAGVAGNQSFDDLIAEERKRQSAEMKRIREIKAACSSDPGICESAIEQGWSSEKAELEMLRANAKKKAPSGHVHSHDQSCTLQALQGAMILRAGGRLDHPAYATPLALAMHVPQWLRAGLNTEQRQRAMESAWDFRDMSMVDLAREACRLDGMEAPRNRSEMIRAAFSGSSLTSIFTTNVSTKILSTYQEAGDTTGEWTQETEVADFKTNERPRMTKSPNLEKLPRGGTADHLTRGDVGESYKIARYAKQIVVDEQDMIDDTFSALQDTPTEMGLAAARLRPDLVYAILLANAALSDSVALFHATHSNLDTTAALAAATLKAAIKGMMIAQESGVNLNLAPTHLIVPPTIKWTAKELLHSTSLVIAGTAGTVTERGDKNTLADEGLKWVSDARLENGVTDPASGTVHAGSASTWFLACAISHTIEVAYLRGTGRAPQVRNFKLDKGQWGIGWDVNMDIGAKALDFKGLRKATA